MKKVMLYLTLILTLPSVVYAGANYMINAKDIYIVRAAERESITNQRFSNYQLVWNEGIHKYELHDGGHQRPINNVDDSLLPFQQEAIPQFYTKELAI